MSTKALTIDQHLPLHKLYPDNCCLCKTEQRIKELEATLSAWHNIFGTSQLTHAQSRLEQAEKEVKQLKNKLPIDGYVTIEFHETHLKENKECYEKQIKELENKLFLSKEVCSVCWTSSYLPVPKNTKGSLKVKGADYNVICQMCEADKWILQLTKAICPDGSITKNTELIDLCKNLWDNYNKITKLKNLKEFYLAMVKKNQKKNIKN